MNTLALYFGCTGPAGHTLHGLRWPEKSKDVGLPWGDDRQLDGALLAAKKIPDQVTGRVYWSWCSIAGAPLDEQRGWFAFVWWDRSGDSRGGSHSGFYVRGFESDKVEAAFAYACSQWPQIVERQTVKLVLDCVPVTQLMDDAKDLATKLAALLKTNIERMTDEQRMEVFELATDGWAKLSDE